MNVYVQAQINPESIIDQLEANGTTFQALLASVSPEMACWKPAPERWSILEVVNHLYDEEREDFRYRLRSLLENPSESWPPIDPEKWVTERDYAGRW